MATNRCAVCGDSIEPSLSLTLPPESIQLMEDSDSIDVAQIEDEIVVHFCTDDAAHIEEIVDSGRSPLSQCDADYAEFTKRAQWKDALGELLIPNYSEEKQRWEDLENRRDFALTTIIIAALVEDDSEVLEPVPDEKILEAKVIYLSLSELGKISGPLVDAVANPEQSLSR